MINKNWESQSKSSIIEKSIHITSIWILTNTFFSDLKRSFHWVWCYKEVLNNWILFSWKKFYLYSDDVFMFEYYSLEEVKTDMEIWKKKFKKKNAITSETIDWRQILEPSWYFEYNWKFYLVWLLYQDINQKDNDENNWVYKWVIVNLWKYFKWEEQIKKVASKIKDIL